MGCGLQRHQHETMPIPESERQSVSRGELRGVLHAILATGFVPAQLYTMSHHIEKAQYAAVERGPDTFTLLSYRISQNPLKMGCFGTKNGSKTHYSKPWIKNALFQTLS